MNQTSTCEAAVSEQPSELTNLIAKGLTSHGVSLRPPKLDDRHRLSITCPGARCTLTVDDGRLVTLEWRPAAGSAVDPKLLADLACTLLTGRAEEQPRQGDAYGRQTVTLKGIVGRELAARDLKVDLEVLEDPLFFDVHTAVVATYPDSGQNAEVRVTDDGSLAWERNYWDEAAVINADPEYGTQAADLEELAADIVATVSMAILLILTRRANRQRPHTTACSRRARLLRSHWRRGGWWRA